MGNPSYRKRALVPHFSIFLKLIVKSLAIGFVAPITITCYFCLVLYAKSRVCWRHMDRLDQSLRKALLKADLYDWKINSGVSACRIGAYRSLSLLLLKTHNFLNRLVYPKIALHNIHFLMVMCSIHS